MRYLSVQSQSRKRQCGCQNANAGKIWIDAGVVEMAPACPHRDSASRPGATRQNQNTCAADDGGITRSIDLLNTSAPQPLRASNETLAVDMHRPTRKGENRCNKIKDCRSNRSRAQYNLQLWGRSAPLVAKEVSSIESHPRICQAQRVRVCWSERGGRGRCL